MAKYNSNYTVSSNLLIGSSSGSDDYNPLMKLEIAYSTEINELILHFWKEGEPSALVFTSAQAKELRDFLNFAIQD